MCMFAYVSVYLCVSICESNRVLSVCLSAYQSFTSSAFCMDVIILFGTQHNLFSCVFVTQFVRVPKNMSCFC